MIELLENGLIEPLGLLPNSSNYTFLARVSYEGAETLAVYKPQAGETPLWDFPDGTLCVREVAAYHASEMLGFGFVPPTVLRDGPHGIGSVQQFIQADLEHHYLTLPESFDDVFRRVCLFDLIINNADRKAGHCLLEIATQKIWVVDHGVCFHHDGKLRTVIWDFAGEPMPDLEVVSAFAGRLPGALGDLLSEQEVDAIPRRIEMILNAKVFPEPGPGRPFPWPTI